MVVNTLQYSTIFQAELDKHLIKYRNIYICVRNKIHDNN